VEARVQVQISLSTTRVPTSKVVLASPMETFLLPPWRKPLQASLPFAPSAILPEDIHVEVQNGGLVFRRNDNT
jgi:hypothetical protein